MFAKLIMAVIIAGIIYFFILPQFRKNKKNKKRTENFIECERCKTFISIEDAVIKDGKYICNDCIKKV